MTKKIFTYSSFMTYSALFISAFLITVTSCAAPYEPEAPVSSEAKAELSSINYSFDWEFSSQEFLSGASYTGDQMGSVASYALPLSSSITLSSSSFSIVSSYEPGSSYVLTESYEPGPSYTPIESSFTNGSSPSSQDFLQSYNSDRDYPPYSFVGPGPEDDVDSSNDTGYPMSGTSTPEITSIKDAILNFKTQNDVTRDLYYAIVQGDDAEAENIFNYMMSKEENAESIYEIQQQILDDRGLLTDIGSRWAEDPDNYDINETLIAQGITDPVDQYLISHYISSFFAP